MTYSIDFRRKVFKIKNKEGLSYVQTAKRFDVGKTTLVRWAKRLEPSRTRNKPATKINMEALKQDVKDYPDAYNYERAERLVVSTHGIWRALKRLNITYKKNTESPKSQSKREVMLSK
ncbi:IS630 transposase-related protein [Rickettsia endosymbiont of Polydrusus tereticollis]|uniref:IS630 transposase-related protein n=1 Tax=Rickettsia endosymbiont of Polydrusus tereticollis TaxID=3066251 RepID=UPI0031331CDE